MKSSLSVATPTADREAVEQAVVRGSELLKQGKLDDAQKAFRAALLLEADNPRVLALLGLAHFRGNQFEPARMIYEDLVERLPTDASHRLNLGLVYLKLGDATKAINALEASRALDPSQGRAVSYLGLAYARAGRYAEAYRSFLLAGQNELASEIESNLTAGERDGIHSQLQRSGVTPSGRNIEPTPVIARTSTPPRPPPKPSSAAVEHDDLPAPVTARAPSRDLPAAFKHTPPSVPIVAVEPEAETDRSRVGVRADARLHTAEGPHAGPEAETDRSRVGHTAAQPDPVPVSVPTVPSNDPNAPRHTESQQFVMPVRVVPAPQVAEGQSMISAAVDIATPTTAGTTLAPRVLAGTRPAIPLSQLATEDLVRPDDGEDTFEISAAGALVIRVTERLLTRLEGVHATGGDLTFEPAMRRSRGHQTDEKFDYGGAQLHTVSGVGYLIAVPSKRAFTAVTLDDDIFYLREDLVFAFEATLRWENGNVPGLRGRLPVVQFRGDGAVALRSEKPLVRVKLPPQGIVFVDAARLAGWIGRVIPRAVVPPSGGPMGDVCIECTGEGVVLVDPIGDPGIQQLVVPIETPKPVEKQMPPPPPPGPAVELDVVKNAEWLIDEGDLDDKPGRDEI